MTLHNEPLCFYYLRMSYLYLQIPRVSLHGRRHHVSTAALNGQTALQSAFRQLCCSSKKHGLKDEQVTVIFVMTSVY